MARVLVVEDNLDILSAVQEALAGEGWDVIAVTSAEEAPIAGRCRQIDVVLCDALLDNGRNGRAVQEVFATDLALAQVPFAS
jgi:DNA-binding response OmpR family regulator